MWNKIKTLLSMDKFNTASKLFLYFLETYGNSDIEYMASINVCKLVRATLVAGMQFLFLFMVILVASLLIVMNYFMFIALWINEGFQLAWYSEVPTIVFMVSNTIFLLIGIGVAKVTIYDDWNDRRNYLRSLNNEPKQKTIFSEWYEAFNNKFCVNIDLNQYRTKKVIEWED